MDSSTVENSYASAREKYAELGVDTERALGRLQAIPLSLHCWQGDDVGGFETRAGGLAGSGLQVTGNAPGRARTIDELRADMAQAFSLIPGRHRVNLHAMYGDFGGKPVDRNARINAKFHSYELQCPKWGETDEQAGNRQTYQAYADHAGDNLPPGVDVERIVV